MTIYTVRDAAGNIIAGDSVLDDALRDVADWKDGTITDEHGTTVYPEPEPQPEFTPEQPQEQADGSAP